MGDSIKHYHTTASDRQDRANGNENTIIKPQKHKRATTSPPENVVARIPDNLIDLEISPSAKNRTSTTSIWLIYNSVPECGEENTVELLEMLSIRNRFSHQEHDYQTPWPRYAKQRPIYINIVRDPIDRLVLNYYSRRNMSSPVTKQEIDRRNLVKPGSGTEWYHRTFEECVLQADPECRYTAGEKSFTLMIPFFCGQHNSAINDRWALQMAKLNIEQEYSVVGVLEKMDQTLSVLAKFVPRFFHEAAQVYSELVKKPSTQHKVSEDVRQVMESELYNEMELYRFIAVICDDPYKDV
ncbi:Heparan sulfate 2-O-sulfotransferase 1 [Orchesella cincta]|uniref:Heparan sulfate 2-O-sulfotransferase 1 n=1 Tax=Orchesella cincta TaxID=48709 RepID=A0A1D2MH44_ORCCI|nr:Heparan sulfate 2-O-sulfotransferase 1 [Orchesella cincta]